MAEAQDPWEMSDDELEAAFNEAKAELDVAPEEEIVEEDNSDSEDEDIDNPDDTDEDESDLDDDSEDNDDNEDNDDLEEPSAESDNVDEDEDANEDEDEDSDEDSEGDDQPDEDEDEQSKDKSEEEDDSKYDSYTKHNVKSDSVDYQLTLDELKVLASKGLNFTKKTQAIAPWRKHISALEEAGVSKEELDIFIDMKKGDKGAAARLLKQAGIDALEMEEEDDANYKPKFHGKTDAQIKLDEAIDHIRSDQEYNITQHVVADQWDEKSREVMIDNPSMIAELHEDIKSGVYNNVLPEANKLKAMDGGKKSDLEYYLMAGDEYYKELDKKAAYDKYIEKETAKREQEKLEKDKAEKETQKKEVAKVKSKKSKQKAVKNASGARKAAATTKSSAGTKGVVDYLDEISDEDFDDWYKKLNI